jgi:hypothetical protein
LHNAHRVTAEDERQRAFVVVVVEEEIPPKVGLERRELVLSVPNVCIEREREREGERERERESAVTSTTAIASTASTIYLYIYISIHLYIYISICRYMYKCMYMPPYALEVFAGEHVVAAHLL